jgi:hypothetical protein
MFTIFQSELKINFLFKYLIIKRIFIKIRKCLYNILILFKI